MIVIVGMIGAVVTVGIFGSIAPVRPVLVSESENALVVVFSLPIDIVTGR